MRNTLLATAVFTAVSLQAHATIIVTWDFETSTPPDVVNATANGPHNPSFGTGSASGLHAATATDWTTPAGNGSANAYSSDTWGVGDYYQFTLSTTGFTQISVSYSQTGSGTGPRNFKLQYSTTGSGGAFTDFTNYTLDIENWSVSTPNLASFRSFDFTGVSALANNSTVAFRIADTSTTSINSGTVTTVGTSRIDDFIVSGSALPEPATAVTLLSGFAMLGLLRRRPSRS